MKSKKNIDDLLREAMETNAVPNYQWNDFSAKLNSKNLFWQRILNKFFILFIGITVLASFFALRDKELFQNVLSQNEIAGNNKNSILDGNNGNEIENEIKANNNIYSENTKSEKSSLNNIAKNLGTSKPIHSNNGEDGFNIENGLEKPDQNSPDINDNELGNKSNRLEWFRLREWKHFQGEFFSFKSEPLELNKLEIKPTVNPRINIKKNNSLISFLRDKSVISIGLESSFVLSNNSINSDPNFVNKDYEQIRNSSEKGGFSYGFVLGWNLNLPINLTFGTGIEYRTTIVNASYNFTIEEVPVIDIDNSIAGYIKLNDTSKQNISFSNKQVQRLISIPLALQYNLRLNNLRSPIIIGGGILISKNLGFSGETINPVFLDERVELNSQYSKLWLINNYNIFLRFPIKSTPIGVLYGGAEYKSLRLNPSNYGSDLTRNYLGVNLLFNLNQ